MFVRTWLKNARSEQLLVLSENEDISEYVLLTGRGWGKTITISHYAIIYALTNPNVSVGICAPTYRMLHNINLFRGKCSIKQLLLDCDVLDEVLTEVNQTDCVFKFFNNSTIVGYSADRPDRLRGAEHNTMIFDEFQDIKEEAISNAFIANRAGGKAFKVIYAGTPKPIPAVKAMVEDPPKSRMVIRGRTVDNKALPASYLKALEKKFKGNKRLIQQELEGKILDSIDGAQWTYQDVERAALWYKNAPEADEMDYLVLAIDPAGGGGSKVGIIVVGKLGDNFYVYDDASCPFHAGHPPKWINEIQRLVKHWGVRHIVWEKNYAGMLPPHFLQASWKLKSIPFSEIVTKMHSVTGSKQERHNPVYNHYANGNAFHVMRTRDKTRFEELQSQMLSYTGASGEKSPDNLDALTIGFKALEEMSQNRILSIAGTL